MRHRLKELLVAVSLGGGVFAFALPAGGQTPPTDTESWGELLDDGAEVGVFQPQSASSPGASTGPRSNIVCTLTQTTGGGWIATSHAELQRQYDLDPSPITINRSCMDGATVVSDVTIDWTPADGDPVDPALLAEMAKARLTLPAPSGDVSPSLGVGTQAQMATYFWLDNWPGEGELPSASASAGGVTVTATATPVSHTWWIRDSVRGTFPVRCGASAGEAYTGTGAPPGGTCHWTPQHSSAGQGTRHADTGEPCFAATVTVVWNVTWDGGDLGSLPTHANTCIVVHEIQAVVSGS